MQTESIIIVNIITLNVIRFNIEHSQKKYMYTATFDKYAKEIILERIIIDQCFLCIIL